MSAAAALFGLFFRLWSRVFVFVAAGWLVRRVVFVRGAGRYDRAIRFVVDLSVYLFVPVFIFTLTWDAALSGPKLRALSGAVLGVLAAGTLFAVLLARAWRAPFRNVCLPVVFMNSIYLALPVNTLLFGADGAAATIVFNFLVTMVDFTLGVWWVRRPGRAWWREILGIPILYAAAAGFALQAAGVPPPGAVRAAARIMAGAAMPVMLLFVGFRTAEASFAAWRRVGLGVAARMAGGAVAGVALAAALGLAGADRGVVIITAAMPPAVNTYVLAEKFESDPAFAAAMIAAGTTLSAFTIPLLAYWLTR